MSTDLAIDRERRADPGSKSVLFIGPLPEPITGQSLACQVFLEELSRHYRVDVVDLTKREFANGVSSASRVVEVVRILVQVWRRRKSASAIYLTVSESYAGNAKDLLIYMLCRKRLSTMVIHLHGGAGMRRLLKGSAGPVRRLNELFLRRLAAAIVLGQRHADIFDTALPPDRIHIVPNFAEDYLFADPTAIERKFNDTSPLRILFLSNLLPGKGASELVAGFLALDEPLRQRVQLDFAGGFESPLQQRTFLRSIEGVAQIRYHGTARGDRKKQLFNDAHVFCLPTYYAYEGQPISILEAYASGCAVITTNHSGIRDIFADRVNGYEVAQRSPSALTEAIARAAADPVVLRSMAQVNRRSAEAQYRSTTYNSNLLRIVASVM